VVTTDNLFSQMLAWDLHRSHPQGISMLVMQTKRLMVGPQPPTSIA
jgi:hypothetical protein